MTIWDIIIFVFLAAAVALEVRDISKMGLRDWYRESCRKSGSQGFAERLPKRLRVIGPAALFLLLVFCLLQISLHKK
jgi:hypothetical protein